MIDFTVAIRAYNAEKTLPDVLNKLKQQINTENIDWEIIVIDNNSIDNTAKIIKEYQSEWDKIYPLKYFFEPIQGASTARKRAINEAQGTFVGFLDDDNIPELNWVEEAVNFAKKYPNVGAYGGVIKPDFEIEPPKDFSKIAVYLAIIDRGKKEFCYNDHKQKVLPPGAGIIISKKAWSEAVPERLFLLGPNGKSLLTKGEDIEILSYIQNAGWEVWYVPQIVTYHKIPAWRLERNYLISLAWGSGLTRHHIRMIRLKPYQRPFAFFAYLINDFRKMIFYWLKNYYLLKNDTVTACEMAILKSIFISPFIV
ncbi:MAG: hormogonium polysaccharide biosynthesis glycosyltransferase HpsE [Cyanobacterium sp.]